MLLIRAVHTYAGLLRASVASASDDHQLGADEGSGQTVAGPMVTLNTIMAEAQHAQEKLYVL